MEFSSLTADQHTEFRRRLFSLIDESIGVAQRLCHKANVALKNGNPLTHADHFTFQYCARSRNALQAIACLSKLGCDDQIGIIGRPLAEGALEVEYLHVETVRGRVRLHVSDKARLLGDFKVIQEHRARNGKLTDSKAKQLKLALAFRREKLEINRLLPWHGSTSDELLKELEKAGHGNNMLRQVKEAFSILSMYTHTSPLDPAYVVNSNEGGYPYRIRCSGYDLGAVPRLSAICGLVILKRTADTLHSEKDAHHVYDLTKKLIDLRNEHDTTAA